MIDLRANSGGLLTQAVAAARLLVPRGAAVVTLCKPSRSVKTYRRRWYHRAYPTPNLVVLVDRKTASAAEIFAGALAASGRALIVGTPTYGKGSSQALVYMSDGSAVSKHGRIRQPPAAQCCACRRFASLYTRCASAPRGWISPTVLNLMSSGAGVPDGSGIASWIGSRWLGP